MVEKIKILDREYEIIDTVEKMTVPDCFVLGANKIGSGHGEAKFYIGNDNDRIRDFWGSEGFKIKGFLLKTDLIKYLNDCKEEYMKPEQSYQQKEKMPILWNERLVEIENYTDIMYFNIKEQTQIIGPRVYVNSTDFAYKIIRKLALPNISYLAAMKLKDSDNNFIFYFKLFVDYFNEIENKKVIAEQIQKIEETASSETEKINLTRARIGQGKYRQDLLELCPICPITLVSDDRLLIASHIKPWAKSSNEEKVDPYNGFMFTPNIDWLFDKGFITFTDDKRMLISPWLSKITCSRLNIVPNKKYDLLPTEGREYYLDYHREEIYKS